MIVIVIMWFGVSDRASSLINILVWVEVVGGRWLVSYVIIVDVHSDICLPELVEDRP